MFNEKRLIVMQRATVGQLTLDDLDKHPVIGSDCEQFEEKWRQSKVVLRILARELADDVHSTRHCAGVAVLQLLLWYFVRAHFRIISHVHWGKVPQKKHKKTFSVCWATSMSFTHENLFSDSGL
jgi:hypothetical protein